jgi:hypothetical protein
MNDWLRTYKFLGARQLEKYNENFNFNFLHQKMQFESVLHENASLEPRTKVLAYRTSRNITSLKISK